MLTRKLQAPAQQMRAQTQLQSVDAEKRTVEVVWSTGYRGLRRTWSESYYEELSMDPAHVSLTRLKGGASVLDTHNGWALRSVLGTVEDAWIENGQGIARLRLSEDPDKAGTVRDILGGIIKNVSIGYNIRKLVEIGRENDIPILRAEDWEPFEISFVPTGFDPLAASRSAEDQTTPCEIILKERNAMTLEEIEAKRVRDEAEKKRVADEALATAKRMVEEGVASERARVRSINEIVSTHKLPSDVAQRMIDENMDISQASRAALDHLAKENATRATSTITMSSEFNEKAHLVRAAEEMLLTRVAPQTFKPTELSAKLRGFSLIDTMKEVLSAEGVSTRGMTPNEICTRGFHTTSDFGSIMYGTLNKVLSNAYQTAPVDYAYFTQPMGVSDYKAIGHYAMSEAPRLLEVKEHAEYKRGSVSTREEFAQLKKHGRIFAVTREAIINDDLNALTNWPRRWGFACQQLQAELAFGVLTSNPLMQDGNALFSTAHANIAGTPTALSEASLGVAVAALRKQTGFTNPDGNVQYLNLRPKYLLVSPELEAAALKLTTAITSPLQLSAINLYSYLEVKVDPRITSATAWYLIADSAGLDTVAMLYLNGEQGPQLDQRPGFDVDGIEYKVRLDTAAKALDWKFAYFNAGA